MDKQTPRVMFVLICRSLCQCQIRKFTLVRNMQACLEMEQDLQVEPAPRHQHYSSRSACESRTLATGDEITYLIRAALSAAAICANVGIEALKIESYYSYYSLLLGITSIFIDKVELCSFRQS